MASRERRMAAFCAAICAAAFSFFALTGAGRARAIDEHVLFAQSESLALRQSLAIPQALERGHFYGRIGTDGNPYAPYGPGWPLLAVPFQAAGRCAAALLHLEGESARGFIAWATSLFNAAAAALAVTALFALVVALGYDRSKVALPLAALAALTTPLWSYAGGLFNEPLAAALVLCAVLALADERRPQRAALIGGACLGALVLVKLAHAVIVPAYLVAVALRKRDPGRSALRELLFLGAPALVAVLVHFAINQAHFGDLLQTGYPASANGKALNSFNAPLLVGLFGLTASPGKGALVFAPLLVLALPLFARFAARQAHAAMLAAAPALLALGFYASYTQWEGGFSYGPRYLVPFLIPLLLPLAELLAARARREAWSRWPARALPPLALLGIAVQLVGCATDWFAEESDRAAYYDSRFDYRLDYFPLPALGGRLLRGVLAAARGGVPAGLENSSLQLARATHSEAAGAVVAAALALVFAVAVVVLARLAADREPAPVVVVHAVSNPRGAR